MLLELFRIFYIVQVTHGFLLDPDLFSSPVKIIKSRGFSAEEHHVLTDDGFYIGLSRIKNPYKWSDRRPRPILIWHGIFFNTLTWITPNKGHLDNNGIYSERNGTLPIDCKHQLGSNLAFTLSACGYDVWLGNQRGTRFSRRNRRYSRFSSLTYVGHSLGTTQMFILLSMEPSYERKINLFIAMAPIVFLGRCKSFLCTTIATFLNPVATNLIVGLGLPGYLRDLLVAVIYLIKPVNVIFYYFFSAFIGWDPYLFEQNSFIAGISGMDFVTTLITFQYGQWILKGNFAQYNYLNPTRNKFIYGQTTAPEYPLENIRLRNIVLIVGRTDLLVDTRDVNKLINSLKGKLREVYLVPSKFFNHGSYPLSPMNFGHVNQVVFKHLV